MLPLPMLAQQVQSVTLNPSSLTGGATAQATIQLNQSAPFGGTLVTLTSNNTRAAYLLAQVTVLPNTNQITTTVFTNPVSTTTSVQITAATGMTNVSTTLTVNPGSAETLVAVADAYVNSGNAGTPPNADNNFGGASVLAVKKDQAGSTSNANRATYLKFDLKDVTVAPAKATLRLTQTQHANNGLMNLYCYGVAETTWTETGITWNNAPGLNRTNYTSTGTFLSQQEVQYVYQPTSVGFDVTSYIAGNLGKEVTLQIVAQEIASTSCALASRETSTKPSLVLSYDAAPTLSELALSPAGVISTGTATGTVKLNLPAPQGGTVVTLADNSASVTLLAGSVTVPAGSRTATFSAFTTAVSEATYATVSGSNNSWSQAAMFTLAPSTETLTIQNLTAAAGNKCIVLRWKELTSGLVKGYNVYRGSATTPLNGSVPIANAIYADIGDDPSVVNLTNGQSYNYTVKVVSSAGAEIASATTGNVTPSAAAPVLNWQSNPPANASGTISLLGSLSGMDGYLLVDGRKVGVISTSEPDDINPRRIIAVLNTMSLTNGQHRVQLVGARGNNALATTSPLMNIANADFSSVASNGILQKDESESASIKMVALAGVQQWTVQVKDANNSVVRSWSLNSVASTLQLSWDGKNSGGSLVSEGQYTINITTQTGTGNKTTQIPVRVLNGPPYALALVSYVGRDATRRLADQDLKSFLQVYFENLQTHNNNQKRFLVLGPNDFAAPNQAALTNKISRWLASSVDVFFLHSHGGFYSGSTSQVMEFATYNDWIRFIPNGSGNNPNVINISQVQQQRNGRPFKFVFLHCCNSAGGDPAGPLVIGSPDVTWANVFGIGGADTAFFGWSSSIFTPYDPNGPAQRSVYLHWVLHFWRLANSYPVATVDQGNAKDQATLATQLMANWPPSVNPWDTAYINGQLRSRLVFFGDILGGVRLYP